MAGRGAQSFKKRQKEQQRKEKQQEKFAKRLERKRVGPGSESGEAAEEPNPLDAFDHTDLPDESAAGESKQL
jgi:hypothetical protein